MARIHVPYVRQTKGYTCGPAALTMVLSYYGVSESEQNLAKELHTTKEVGTRHQAMIDGVLKRGLHCYVNDNATLSELRYLLSYNVPVIVRFLEPTDSEDHYGVVVGLDRFFVSVHNPWSRPNERHFLPHFKKRWTCDVLGNCNQWLMAVSQDPLPLGRQYHPHNATT